MNAVSLVGTGEARVIETREPQKLPGELLLKVEMVGLCGTDLNSFRGRNPLVTVSPYTSCGQCASCRRGRFNACRDNQTFGVQRDGALTEWITVPEEKVYPSSSLSLKELCLVEPLTVGVHAVARGRVASDDIVVVFGCGGVGLGAIAGAAFRGARTIAVDLDDAKLETARAAGATDLIHSAREDFRTRLREITQGHGPDVVIEAIGLPETFRGGVEEVAFTGRVVYIGYAK